MTPSRPFTRNTVYNGRLACLSKPEQCRILGAFVATSLAELVAELDKVRDRAYTVHDRDVEALKEAGVSEDEIFEQTVAVAIAEGLRRLDRADEAIG